MMMMMMMMMMRYLSKNANFSIFHIPSI